jgi:hypothetical protein
MALAEKCGGHMPGGADSRQRQAVGRLGRMTMAGAALCGMAGFFLGAAFWIVLGALSLAGGPLPEPLPGLESHAPHSTGCTSLALDRHNGHTTAEPCRGISAPLREAVASARTDLMH